MNHHVSPDFIKTTEVDPIALFNQVNLSRWDYAEVLGVSKPTVDLWCSGHRNPSRPIRRLAAELAHRWNVNFGS